MDLRDTIKPYLDEKNIDMLFSSFSEKDTHAVLLNHFKISNEEFLSNHKDLKPHPVVKNAFIFDKEVFPLGKEFNYEVGAYSIQDPSAMLPAFFLNPNEDDIVLDMCAAPGGKSIQLALEMNNQGILVANDLSYQRAKDLSQNIERMGLGSVIVTSNDLSLISNKYKETFSKILLDAPCSGSSMFRKNELVKDDWTIQKVESCAAIQKDLLNIAFEMLKPGGILCYSTCSFSYQEDDFQILEFLKSHPEMSLISIPQYDGFYRSKMLPEAVHIFPTMFEGEGQFFALLRKNGEFKKPSFSIQEKQKSLQIPGISLNPDRSNEIINNTIYSLTHHFDVSKFNTLRYGVKVAEISKNLEPDHNYSHFLDSSNSIELTEDQVRKYFRGETFPLNGENGFKIVSFKKINIGWIKLVNGIAKNHYPKGLRKQSINL